MDIDLHNNQVSNKRTVDPNKAIVAQSEYLKRLAKKYPDDWMAKDFSKGVGFAPRNGVCYNCLRQIYNDVVTKQRNWKTGELKKYVSEGISVERASTEITTSCPHCHISFVD